MNEVQIQKGVEGLDFEEKLIVAVYESLVVEKPSIGINEHACIDAAVKDVEAEYQRQLLVGGVAPKIDERIQEPGPLEIRPLRVIDGRVAGKCSVEEETVGRV